MPSGLWFFWIGNQGRECLDLGRLWQILPVCYLALRMVAHRNRPGDLPPGSEVERLTEAYGAP